MLILIWIFSVCTCQLVPHARYWLNTLTNTRFCLSDTDFSPMTLKKENFKQSLIYSGPVIWNSLPDCLKNLETVDSFHRHCIKWMKSSLSFNLWNGSICPMHEHNFECKIVNMFWSPVLSFSLVLTRTVSLRRFFWVPKTCVWKWVTIKALLSMYIKLACVYVGLKEFHAACIILYTCKSSLYFIIVLFFGGSL